LIFKILVWPRARAAGERGKKQGGKNGVHFRFLGEGKIGYGMSAEQSRCFQSVYYADSSAVPNGPFQGGSKARRVASGV